MSKKCLLSGKKSLSGNNVAHSNRKTKRKFVPNLKKIRFYSQVLDRTFRLKIAVSTLRTINKKGGFDEYMQSVKLRKLEKHGLAEAKKIKRLFDKKMSSSDSVENKEGIVV